MRTHACVCSLEMIDEHQSFDLPALGTSETSKQGSNGQWNTDADPMGVRVRARACLV